MDLLDRDRDDPKLAVDNDCYHFGEIYIFKLFTCIRGMNRNTIGIS